MLDRSNRKTGEWLILAGFAALGAFVFAQIATSLTDQGAASGDALYNAALVPRVVTITMLGLGLFVALRLILGRGADATDAQAATPPEPMRKLRRMQGGIILLIAAYLLLLEPLGFAIATTLGIGAMFAVLGVRPMWAAFLTGAGLMLVVAFIFEGLLKVVLPVGFTGVTLPFHLLGV